MKKRIAVGVVIVLGVLIGFLVTRNRGVDVSVATVTPDTLSVTVPAEGRTRGRDRFTVAAPITGRLTRLTVQIGDMVEEGQLLGRLYPAPDDPRVVATVQAEVSAAEARFLDAESRLREAGLQAVQAEREAERRRPLFEMGAITRERLEQAELQAVVAQERRESAEAGLASARAALEGAQARLLGSEATDREVAPVDVRAPVAGRVERVPDESERVVAAGSPIVYLSDAEGLEVVLDILSEDAVGVHPGDPIVIRGWGGDHDISGEVRTVTLVGYTKVSALGVEEQRVDVIGDLHDPPPTLGTGYRVSGEIVVWRGADVLAVPTSALFRVGGAWEVFVLDGRRARRREVVLGHRNEASAEVTDGLEAGDRVIVFPPEEVEEGVVVNVVGELGS
jgi:HlyD family secretion protein